MARLAILRADAALKRIANVSWLLHDVVERELGKANYFNNSNNNNNPNRNNKQATCVLVVPSNNQQTSNHWQFQILIQRKEQVANLFR